MYGDLCSAVSCTSSHVHILEAAVGPAVHPAAVPISLASRGACLRTIQKTQAHKSQLTKTYKHLPRSDHASEEVQGQAAPQQPSILHKPTFHMHLDLVYITHLDCKIQESFCTFHICSLLACAHQLVPRYGRYSKRLVAASCISGARDRICSQSTWRNLSDSLCPYFSEQMTLVRSMLFEMSCSCIA